MNTQSRRPVFELIIRFQLIESPRYLQPSVTVCRVPFPENGNSSPSQANRGNREFAASTRVRRKRSVKMPQISSNIRGTSGRNCIPSKRRVASRKAVALNLIPNGTRSKGHSVAFAEQVFGGFVNAPRSSCHFNFDETRHRRRGYCRREDGRGEESETVLIYKIRGDGSERSVTLASLEEIRLTRQMFAFTLCTLAFTCDRCYYIAFAKTFCFIAERETI